MRSVGNYKIISFFVKMNIYKEILMRMKTLLKFNFKLIQLILELSSIPSLLFFAVISRYVPREIDIGLGPMPLINNVHHKKALELRGFKAETFVDKIYFITKEFDKKFVLKSRLLQIIIPTWYIVFLFSIFRYRCLYIYFNGGPLHETNLIWRIEPFLYKLARMRIVIMPFGGDIQNLLRTTNLLFRHTMSQDYPLQKYLQEKINKKIDIWTFNADHVIAGCDWVEYMYFWHTLMISHFSIDTQLWAPANRVEVATNVNPQRKFRVLHAPNHKAIKGTDFLVQAIAELHNEGESIELVMVQKVTNEEIRKLISSVDLVADQFIIGWYAMFAIEAMAMGKPVLCYLRNDLERFYIDSGLLKPNEIPLIKCSPSSIKDTLRSLIRDPDQLAEASALGPAYVKRHHSLEAVGAIFSEINHSIGITPIDVNAKKIMEIR